MARDWGNYRKATMRWLDGALSWVYPNVCQVCQENPACARAGYVCDQCRADIRFIRDPICHRCGLPFQGDLTTEFECTNCRELELHFDRARSAVMARGLVLDVIHRYKYQQHTWFEPFLADLLIDRALPLLKAERWDVLVPVPLHRVRQRERGFNQATRLAKRLGQAVGIPVNTRVLKRVRPTPPQTRLSRGERMKNMRTAFAGMPNVRLQGKAVVVLDDVFTTGATTSACARVLREHGAVRVCVWTLARGV